MPQSLAIGTENQVVACTVLLLPSVDLTFLLDFTFVPATNIRAFQKLFLCRLRYYLNYLHTKRCSAFRVDKSRRLQEKSSRRHTSKRAEQPHIRIYQARVRHESFNTLTTTEPRETSKRINKNKKGVSETERER
jgi:hypothetical protein